MIPTTNKARRVTRETTAAIDHILTNQSMNVNFKTIIFNTDISDPSPVCNIIPSTEKLITDEATEYFNQALYETDWAQIETCDNPSECYKLLFKTFLTIYKNFFQKKLNKTKGKGHPKLPG